MVNIHLFMKAGLERAWKLWTSDL